MVPLGAIIGCEFWVYACGAVTLTGELQVLAWSSDHTTACREPSGFPNGSVRNGVQNWYTRPRCGLVAPVSTTSQFLSSENAHVELRCGVLGAPKVRPPSSLRKPAHRCRTRC